jgi:hypothetical protein
MWAESGVLMIEMGIESVTAVLARMVALVERKMQVTVAEFSGEAEHVFQCAPGQCSRGAASCPQLQPLFRQLVPLKIDSNFHCNWLCNPAIHHFCAMRGHQRWGSKS